MRPRVKRLASGKLVLCVGLEGQEEQVWGAMYVCIQLTHSVEHDIVKQLYSN